MRIPMACKVWGFMILVASCHVCAQSSAPYAENTRWDFSVWAAGETGEETSNSFAQAQIWTTGIFCGRTLTGEVGNGWGRGRLEYAADFVPVFETYGNQRTHGVGFDPVILRWNLALHTSRMSPYIELSGGGVSTPVNLPPGKDLDLQLHGKRRRRILSSHAIPAGFRRWPSLVPHLKCEPRLQQ